MKRNKDVPTVAHFRARSEREFYRLISDLAFCYELLDRPHLLIPEVDSGRSEIQSIHMLFHSCEECAISAVTRLWENTSDSLSLPYAKNQLTQIWPKNTNLPDNYEANWLESYEALNSSQTLTSLLILGDEEFGHNIIDSGKRVKSAIFEGVGPVGQRGFLVARGELLEFCHNTAVLLFQTIAPFTENPALIENYLRRFEIKMDVHRKAHSALGSGPINRLSLSRCRDSRSPVIGGYDEQFVLAD